LVVYIIAIRAGEKKDFRVLFMDMCNFTILQRKAHGNWHEYFWIVKLNIEIVAI